MRCGTQAYVNFVLVATVASVLSFAANYLLTEEWTTGFGGASVGDAAESLARIPLIWFRHSAGHAKATALPTPAYFPGSGRVLGDPKAIAAQKKRAEAAIAAAAAAAANESQSAPPNAAETPQPDAEKPKVPSVASGGAEGQQPPPTLAALAAPPSATPPAVPSGYKPVSLTSLFLKLLIGDRLPANLSRCALVGSSAVLLQKGRGPEIDAYTTVIRVNRIPRARNAPDMGNRTDILFGNCRTYMDLADNLIATLNGPKVTCTRQICPPIFVLKFCRMHLTKKTATKFARRNLTIAGMGRKVFEAANVAKGRRPTMPMTGVYAFFTFAPLCDSLTVYGFGGGTKASIDGVHPHRKGLHNGTADNEMLDRLLSENWKMPEGWIRKDEQPQRWLRRWVPELRKKSRIIRD